MTEPPKRNDASAPACIETQTRSNELQRMTVEWKQDQINRRPQKRKDRRLRIKLPGNMRRKSGRARWISVDRRVKVKWRSREENHGHQRRSGAKWFLLCMTPAPHGGRGKRNKAERLHRRRYCKINDESE